MRQQDPPNKSGHVIIRSELRGVTGFHKFRAVCLFFHGFHYRFQRKSVKISEIMCEVGGFWEGIYLTCPTFSGHTVHVEIARAIFGTGRRGTLLGLSIFHKKK